MLERITSDLLREPKIPIGFLNDLNRCTSQEEVFAAYAEWSSRIISADRTTVAIAVHDDGMLDLMAIDGNKAIATGSRIPIEGTLIGRVFRTQNAEICSNLLASSDGEAAPLAAGGLTSVMDVPLTAGTRRFGVLAQGFADPPPPKERDLVILQAIANCLASHLLLQEQLVTLGEMALTDPLTQLYNRRAFDDRVSALWSRFRREGRTFAIAIIDLDHFKAINDTHGHDFGDEVLKVVANTLSSTARPTDTVARIGGEEFCIALEDTGLEDALAIVDRLRDRIGALEMRIGKTTIGITASIGVAVTEEDHDSPRLVSMLADRALYQAKQDGRNRVKAAA